MFERIRSSFYTRLQGELPVLQTSPYELASIADEARKVSAVAVVLDLPKAEVQKDLAYGALLSASHFSLAAKQSSQEEILIEGNLHRIPWKEITAFTSVSDWMLGVRSAMIIRDKASLAKLTASASVVFGKDFSKLSGEGVLEGQFYFALAEGRSKDTSEHLQKFLAFNTDKDPNYRQQLRIPELKVWESVLGGKTEEACTRLTDALNRHKAFWGSDDKRSIANGWTSLPLIHVAAYAYDHGMHLAVESDYLPQWLVAGDFA